ncbi:hypothetical protein [Natronomonas marina]|jgi:hypothetical protein|uniref:hypothetical protein n=1 Tax=Natronomonas marina TaxID=2961939 RepID=UPI0020C97F1C|nr:hypothetical protein [Natronomonas marina]
MNIRATALAALLVTSVIGAAAAPAATQQAEGEAYSGTFVQFETASSAVTDYAVDGSVVVENVTVQSASETDGGIGLDAGISSSIVGSAVELETQADAAATVAFGSGAEMETHDNQRGVVQLTASDGDQIVQANVSGEAEAESDERVVVSNGDGTQGTFIVVGDGNVTTGDDGQVTARVEEDSQLVYRQYDEERSESDRKQERMIRNGTATAEVYVYGAAESGANASDDAEDNATSVVEYGQDTTVEVQERSESSVNMTVERAESQGKVVITTVSESTVENAEDIEVYVDGEAAAQADSYSEVRSATNDGEQSRYLVRQDSSAQAAADVVVGINHFSERSVSMQSAEGNESTDDSMDDGNESDSEDDSAEGDQADDGTSGDGAGFGVVAVVAALAAALVAVRRRP